VFVNVCDADDDGEGAGINGAGSLAIGSYPPES
jgi:hypothetical protein